MKEYVLKLLIAILMIAFGSGLIGYTIAEKYYKNNYHKGYDEAMLKIVNSLAKVDEVRIGNLVINEPNAVVSNCLFFVLDPNIIATEVNGENTTGMDCYYEFIGSSIPEPFIEQLNRFNTNISE